MTLNQLDGFAMNLAICKALGLDPTNIRRGGVRLTLSDTGPIVEVEYWLRDGNGEICTRGDELLTTLKHYKLEPIGEDK